MVVYLFCSLLWLSVACAASLADEITIAVSRSPLSAPFLVAKQEGYFSAEGLTVELQECLGGHRCFQDMLAGKADFATCSEQVVTYHIYNQSAFRLLASFAYSADDTQLVVSRSAGIKSPMDLNGKRVGYIRDSASHYFLDKYLLMGGADPDSVQRIELKPENMAKALSSRQVDAISVWHPWLEQAVRESQGDAYALTGIRPYNVFFNLVGSPEFLSRNPQTALRLIRALVRAEKYIQANSLQAASVVRDETGLREEGLAGIWPAYHFRVELRQELMINIQNGFYWRANLVDDDKKAAGDAQVTVIEPEQIRRFILDEPLRQLDPERVQL